MCALNNIKCDGRAISFGTETLEDSHQFYFMGIIEINV